MTTQHNFDQTLTIFKSKINVTLLAVIPHIHTQCCLNDVEGEILCSQQNSSELTCAYWNEKSQSWVVFHHSITMEICTNYHTSTLLHQDSAKCFKRNQTTKDDQDQTDWCQSIRQSVEDAVDHHVVTQKHDAFQSVTNPVACIQLIWLQHPLAVSGNRWC